MLKDSVIKNGLNFSVQSYYIKSYQEGKRDLDDRIRTMDEVIRSHAIELK